MLNFIIRDSFEEKGRTNIESVKVNTEKSLKHINDKYENDETLNEIILFCDYLFVDAFKADLDTLKRIGFYPSTEADYELEFSIKELLSGNYKCSIDHMRRAFELTITAIYFTLDEANVKKARAWMSSNEVTPSFSGTMIKSLIKKNRFREINELHQWSNDVKQHYWILSDYVHVKGMEKGYRNLNIGSIIGFPGNRVLPINIDTLDSVLDLFIKTVQHILVSLYLYNPILLVGMPIDEKFGINPPIGGYFNDAQAESMKKLIPEEYKVFFENLINSDEEIKAISNWFFNQPDAQY